MTVRIRPTRVSSDGRASTRSALPDNRLALLDQSVYDGHRSVGQQEIMQVGWVYERAVDFDGLERFHHHLSQGLLGRLIERSPLPFGRHRWVIDPQPTEIDIAGAARPRAELGDWFDECTQLPMDPESGPGWRLSVVPLTDGSTAISLVLSHYVIDGIGAALAVTEAVMGVTRDLGYPPPRSRTRRHAVLQDAGETIRDAPAVTRALVAAVKEARRRRRDEPDRSRPPRSVAAPTRDMHEPFRVPNLTMQIKLDEWNSRAASLGGTNSALAVAFTAKLDQHMGCQHGDSDDVATVLTVNNRTGVDDARAVAVSFTRAGIDPTDVTTDLSAARTAIRDALKTFKEAQDQDETTTFAPLTPFTPKRAWQQMIEYALNDPEQPVVCSNLGDTGPAAIRPDGTLCDAVFARGASQHLTRQWMERIGNRLNVYHGTAAEINIVCISVYAYHPDTVTTNTQLRELVTQTLAEFDLTAEII